MKLQGHPQHQRIKRGGTGEGSGSHVACLVIRGSVCCIEAGVWVPFWQVMHHTFEPHHLVVHPSSHTQAGMTVKLQCSACTWRRLSSSWSPTSGPRPTSNVHSCSMSWRSHASLDAGASVSWCLSADSRSFRRLSLSADSRSLTQLIFDFHSSLTSSLSQFQPLTLIL